MKKLVYILLSILSLSSCTLETSDNGKLDGFWHLERIDTLSTGGSLDLKNDRVFWAVENKLLQFQSGSTTYSCHFRNTNDSLILIDVFRSYGHEEDGQGGDVEQTDVNGIRQFGVQHLNERLFKESLKGSNMVLRTDSVRLYFKKF